MPAHPKAGQRYRQEYYKGHAEDRARLLFARRGLVMTADSNPLPPKLLEYKFYSRGVGPILSVGVSGGSDREELVSYRRGG
jgi:hypothetical protein